LIPIGYLAWAENASLKELDKHNKLINKIYEVISPHFEHIFVEKRRGTGLIQIFDESELVKGKQSRYKVANSDMLVLDEEEKPLLVIEPETSASPKTFGRSIPIYTIAKKVRIGKKEYSISSPLLLLIVIPDQSRTIQKTEQLFDLEKKLKEAIDFEGSSLKDFAICQIGDLEEALGRFKDSNGYCSYSSL